jgi:hypothetical protein
MSLPRANADGSGLARGTSVANVDIVAANRQIGTRRNT